MNIDEKPKTETTAKQTNETARRSGVGRNSKVVRSRSASRVSIFCHSSKNQNKRTYVLLKKNMVFQHFILMFIVYNKRCGVFFFFVFSV